MPDVNLSGLRAGATDSAAALQRLSDPAVAGPRVAAFMLEARRAFQSLERAGFERTAASQVQTVEGHAAAAEHLPRIRARLNRFCERLKARGDMWSELFARDSPLFAARFQELYGAPTAATRSVT
jgi:hypothetical protein